jgi:segregation and condensation protein B
MSLKSKVEAVVYAAEEPVTLAQLAGIFASEVLEELEAAANQPPQESSQESAEDSGERSSEQSPQALLEELLPTDGPRGESAGADLFSEEQGAQTPSDAAQAGPPDAEQPFSAHAGEKEEEKIDEKKAARQRDRQVRDALQKILDQLIAEYADGHRGIEIREIAGGYRMATKPEYHDAVRAFVKSLKPPMKLSLQALETLAVVAYKQPITAPEVSEIRGVDSGGVLGSLISRKLITTAGRKHVIGRPILYKTTKEFLLRFGLKDLNELPSMEEFEKMAGELAQAEAEAEDAAMRSAELPLGEHEAGRQPAETEPAEQEQTDSQQPGEDQPEATEVQNQQPIADQAVLVNAGVVTEETVPLAGSDGQGNAEQVSSDDEAVELAAEAVQVEPLDQAADAQGPEERPQLEPAEEPVQTEHVQEQSRPAHGQQGTDADSYPENLKQETEDLDQDLRAETRIDK